MEVCIQECMDSLEGFSQPIDLAVVFVQSSLRHEMGTLPEVLRQKLNPRVLIGCTGGGVIGDAVEVEMSPALSITVAHLPGVELRGFSLQDDELPSPDAPPEAWKEILGLSEWAGPVNFLLLADAFDFELEALLRGLDYAFPGSRCPKLGGLASDARQAGGNRLILNEQMVHRGMVGLALAGNLVVEPVVAQGCRPIGSVMTITRGEKNLIFELDGHSPLEVLDKTMRSLSRRDRQLAESSLFLGIAGEAEITLASILNPPAKVGGDFLIRNLIGLEPRKNALVVGAHVRPGQAVQFHLRDAQASAEDLVRMLDRYESTGARPEGCLLFSCLGRGEYLYKVPNHDSGEFRRRFPEVALGGFFCNGEIGPVGPTSYLHGYTSCFAMFRSKGSE